MLAIPIESLSNAIRKARVENDPLLWTCPYACFADLMAEVLHKQPGENIRRRMRLMMWMEDMGSWWDEMHPAFAGCIFVVLDLLTYLL